MSEAIKPLNMEHFSALVLASMTCDRFILTGGIAEISQKVSRLSPLSNQVRRNPAASASADKRNNA